jgi:hypothetical protein
MRRFVLVTSPKCEVGGAKARRIVERVLSSA